MASATGTIRAIDSGIQPASVSASGPGRESRVAFAVSRRRDVEDPLVDHLAAALRVAENLLRDA